MNRITEYGDFVGLAQEIAAMKKRLQKAEHDRDRYAKRIMFLQLRQEILSREYNAVRVERDILKTALTACEKSLKTYEEGEKPCSI